MDVLVTCLNYPYPLENGENLRIFHYVRALRARHTFDLVCRGSDEVPPPLRDLFRHVVPVLGEMVLPRGGVLRRLAASFSVDQTFPAIPDLTSALAICLDTRRYDLIWSAGDVLPRLPQQNSVPVLGDIVDDLVLQYRRLLASLHPGIRYLRVLKRLQLMKSVERRYFGRADACLYVSEADARSFASVCPDTPVHVIHNGVDETFFRPEGVAVESETLVFEGNMSFYPNVDAAEYFCTEILPLVHAVKPAVKFILVGKNPSSRVRALASDHVAVTGFVDDIRPYLSRAAVFVSPTRVGAGIKNKILQAWSMGKAVVATPASTGGLRVRDRQNLIIADSPRSFADAVLELLEDENLREGMGASGRQTVLDHYTWNAKALEMEALMIKLTARRMRHA
ncbi:MAG: glycosyltransferase [Burkholderiales bacterium]|nr:glycosyltransferase [Burkholderiales bacterium]